MNKSWTDTKIHKITVNATTTLVKLWSIQRLLANKCVFFILGATTMQHACFGMFCDRRATIYFQRWYRALTWQWWVLGVSAVAGCLLSFWILAYQLPNRRRSSPRNSEKHRLNYKVTAGTGAGRLRRSASQMHAQGQVVRTSPEDLPPQMLPELSTREISAQCPPQDPCQARIHRKTYHRK